MLMFGAAALVVASVLAWLDVRQGVAPLRRVAAAAQRIAAGDLAVPLADGGGRRRDEVGRLTVALDTMRGRLVRSLAEINEGNLQLERRVRQRTEELAAITAQHRQLLNKVIWAQEEERKRLARELHDDTLQTLSGVAMSLQAIEDGLPPHLARERERLAWAKSQAVHAAREIRQLMLDLRPSVLDDLGLVPAVRWYVTTHLEPFGVHARIDAPDTLPPLPSTVQTVAFRVLQEAVANVAKHAHASRADICIEVADHCLRAGVADDGRGFDPSALRAARREAADERLSATSVGAGLGLLGMEERVGLMGGQLEVESQPGAGTRVRFTIPLPSNDAPEPDSDVVEPLLLDRAPVGAALGGLP